MYPAAPSPPTCSHGPGQGPPGAILPAPGFGSGSPPGSVVGLGGYPHFIARSQAQGVLMDVPDQPAGHGRSSLRPGVLGSSPIAGLTGGDLPYQSRPAASGPR